MDLTEAEIGEEEHQQEGYREREECDGSSESSLQREDSLVHRPLLLAHRLRVQTPSMSYSLVTSTAWRTPLICL